MKKAFFIAVLCVLSLVGGLWAEARAAFIPVFYESSVVLGGGSVLPMSGGPSGEHFVLDPARGELIYLNNALNESRRVVLPNPDGAWYNEVVAAQDGTVWVSSGYYSRRKVFMHYDANGALLKRFYYEDWSMAYVSNWGIQLDGEGYLYFISSMYSAGGGTETWLIRLEPRNGSLAGRWRVPVDGAYRWYRGMVLNSRGELLWGNFESHTIYKFSPQTGQTAAFAYLPASTQNDTMSLAIDAADNLYAVEQPSAFWRYDPSYLYLFDSTGDYRGRREVDFQAAGVGLAAYADEIVLSSYYMGILIKYTSICKNSAEYPYCVYTLKGVEELTQHYMTLGRIKEADGQKMLLELKKAGEDLQKNMINSARNTLSMLIHYVGVKAGRTIDGDVGAIFLSVLEQTRDNLQGNVPPSP